MVIIMNENLNEKEKSVEKYTKEKLIRQVAQICERDLKTIHKIYDALEEVVASNLATANEEKDVQVRLFEGISINSTFLPERSYTNYFVGEEMKAKEKIKVKANITRRYSENLTKRNE